MQAAQKSKLLVILCLVVPLLIAVTAYFSSRSTGNEHVAEINQVIAAQGGKVQEIVVVPHKDSPFEKSGKGNTIYKITYEKDGQVRTAWYRAVNYSSIVREEPEWKFE